MVLDASLLNTQHYKIWIKVKWSNPGKRIAPSLHLCIVAIENGSFGSPSTTVVQLVYICIYTKDATEIPSIFLMSSEWR